MTPKEFRAELTNTLPGYSWTVHNKSSKDRVLHATGKKVSGFNRLSTVLVERRDRYGGSGFPRYHITSAGFGGRAPFLGEYEDRTLSRALRGLQNHYEQTAARYASHARNLQSARPSKELST